MKLIIGLGNPEERFVNNRHNVGHRFAEFLIYNLQFTMNFQISNFKFQISKTDCFMNESGEFVKKAMKNNLSDWSDLSNLVIVHDDLDLRLGLFKIQLGVGPKDHKGINSIEKALGRTDFWRVRIGVDGRDPHARTQGEQYVLQDFLPEEQGELDKLFPKIWGEIQKKMI